MSLSTESGDSDVVPPVRMRPSAFQPSAHIESGRFATPWRPVMLIETRGNVWSSIRKTCTPLDSRTWCAVGGVNRRAWKLPSMRWTVCRVSCAEAGAARAAASRSAAAGMIGARVMASSGWWWPDG